MKLEHLKSWKFWAFVALVVIVAISAISCEKSEHGSPDTSNEKKPAWAGQGGGPNGNNGGGTSGDQLHPIFAGDINITWSAGCQVTWDAQATAETGYSLHFVDNCSCFTTQVD